MEYVALAELTRGFTAGEPRAISVSADGSSVFFLRSAGPHDPVDRLWVFDTERGTERLVVDPTDPAPVGPHQTDDPISSYAIDRAGRTAAMALAGRLVVADLMAGTTNSPRVAAPVLDPVPDPTGRRIAYVADGSLRVVDRATGEDTLLAGESGVTWGVAEFVAARDFGRTGGYWWSPDGLAVLATRVDSSRVRPLPYPIAGTPNAEVTLHLLDLDGGWVDVHWDRETYPYLVAVSWSDVGGPLVTVLRRLQQHGLVLAVDPRTGETQVHAELADPRWVEPVAGTPCHLPDGRVLIGGELAHDGYDARCLFADGGLLTPPSLYVRRVAGRLGPDLVVEASEGEPSEQHLYRVGTHSGSASVEVQRLTSSSGWHRGYAAGDTLVVGAASLDHSGTQWTVRRRSTVVSELSSYAAPQPYAPRPALQRVTDRRLPAGVVYPRAHVGGRRLPVLVDVYGGPGHQEVIAARTAWQERQWWADAGFAVVVIDNRGTPGVAPSFEKVVHRRLADVILTDQVDALAALADKHPDLDLTRIGIRGWGFGGWLAALAVLRRPEVYRCGVAGSPVSDWLRYDTAYAERYLGLPDDASDVYAHNSLLESAAEPMSRGEGRPLLLIYGEGDQDVPPVHARRLGDALASAGRPLTTIALDGPARRLPLLPRELDFVRTYLGTL
jgi:dipeptidyl-peptidase-4